MSSPKASLDKLTVSQKNKLRTFFNSIKDTDEYEFVILSDPDKMRALIALKKQNEPDKCVVSGGTKKSKPARKANTRNKRKVNKTTRKNKSKKVSLKKLKVEN